MAITFAKGQEWSAGGFRAMTGVFTITAGTTSGAVATGMEYIAGGAVTPKSCDSTLQAKVYFNTGSAATAINGYVDIANGTAGDDYHAVLFGY
jgi:hypothetical protein